MARIRINIGNMTLATEGCNATISIGSDEADKVNYDLSLTDLKLLKKMYQPTEVLADLTISASSGNTDEWNAINRKTIESTFKHQKVVMEVVNDNNEVTDTIGDDYYVHEVEPCYKTNSMTVKLKIYSLDKLLTVGKSCYSYAAKKLASDILASKLKDPDETDGTYDENKIKQYYKKPYDTNSVLEFNAVNMQVLKYSTDSGDELEHIHPYLVQYNESFYDMLSRTCNRWGEFLYWEDGKLNIGYDSTAEVKKVESGFSTITYPNMNSDTSLSGIVPSDGIGSYFPVGADDSTIRDTIAGDEKWHARAKLGTPNYDYDRYWVSKVHDLFAMDQKFLPWLCSTLVFDLVDWCVEEIAQGDRNHTFKEDFFPDGGVMDGTVEEQYNSSKNKLSEFTEINTTYNTDKYKEIIEYELKAFNNMVEIDYDTTWPGMKLGSIIQVNGEQFIVVEVSSKIEDSNLKFRIKGIGAQSDKFYPTMLPTGHVRHCSSNQKATVRTDSEEDPADQNRVKVSFAWQETSNGYYGDLSPRLRIASSDGGANMVSRYYTGETVLVGFAGGNIECPYVLGAAPTVADPEFGVRLISTPGQHRLKLHDGEGVGLIQLLEEAFLPCMDTLTTVLPETLTSFFQFDSLENWDKNKYFEGGFTLSDRYGIYEITGCTDERKVEIKSPWGEIEMGAFTGINLKAPNGTIKIEGKNVEITAGNNVTITSGQNIKDKADSEDSAFSLNDIAVAVVTKLAEEYLQVIDLTLVRAAIDIFRRPVEGALTLKSMRYMKLEAGLKNECEYPAIAFNTEKKMELANKENKDTISLLGSDRDKKSLSFGTLKLFDAVKDFALSEIRNWEKRSKDLVEKRKAFEDNVNKLLNLANDKKKPVCKSYKDLQKDFWAEGEYEEWSEDKFGFDEANVPTEPKSGKKFVSVVSPTLLAGVGEAEKESTAVARCTSRKSQRDEILKSANELRKLICQVLNYDITEDDVTKFVESYKIVTAPEDYIDKVLASVSKEKCPNAAIFGYPEDKRTLQTEVSLAGAETKYLKRLYYYNLLNELGFDKDTRRKINNNEKTVADPDVSLKSDEGENSLVNSEYWHQFVQSLSGVPVIKREQNSLGSQLIDVLKDATGWNDILGARKDWKKYNIWGEGKEGRILLGSDGNTYEFKKQKFEEIQPFEPTNKSFTEQSAGLKDKDKNNLTNFMNKLRSQLDMIE